LSNPDLELRLNSAVDSGGPPTAEIRALSQPGVFDTIPGRAGHHAPALAELPDGTLLAAWSSYAGPHELQDTAIYTARRPIGGGWSTPVKLIEREAAVGNPVLYAEGERVWLFYAVAPLGWGSASIEFVVSEDAGETWSAPRAMPGPIGSNVRFPPIRLSSGELLLPAYDDLLQRSLFFASDDGTRWTLRSMLESGIPSSNIQPSIVERGDGSVLAVMRNSESGGLWSSQSLDGGRRWAAPRETAIPNPASPAALLRLQSGTLMLIFNDSPEIRCPLSAAYSFDDGASWTAGEVLADCPGEVAYPAAMQDAAGTVHVLYSHDRRYIGHIEMAENE
jgi:predicted neuraminidase